MRGHSALGPGFSEVVYQGSLALEMERVDMPFVRKIEQPVFYLNQ